MQPEEEDVPVKKKVPFAPAVVSSLDIFSRYSAGPVRC